jgi:CRP/FNR family transcriptional regulator
VEGVPHACAHITQEELAALAGSVREVVQRALKTLENAGAIRLGRARIDILDPDVLEDWAGGET